MSNITNKEIERISKAFSALSNPTRVAIFRRLADCCGGGDVCSTGEPGAPCVGDLGRGIDVAASTVSHHIRTLRHAGLIRVERRGQRVTCRIDGAVVTEIARFLVGVAERVGEDAEATP